MGVDASAKYVHQDNGPDYPIDVHAWFFKYTRDVQANNEPVATTNQWMSPEINQPHATLGATSLSHQDSPPTYESAMVQVSQEGGYNQVETKKKLILILFLNVLIL